MSCYPHPVRPNLIFSNSKHCGKKYQPIGTNGNAPTNEINAEKSLPKPSNKHLKAIRVKSAVMFAKSRTGLMLSNFPCHYLNDYWNYQHGPTLIYPARHYQKPTTKVNWSNIIGLIPLNSNLIYSPVRLKVSMKKRYKPVLILPMTVCLL